MRGQRSPLNFLGRKGLCFFTLASVLSCQYLDDTQGTSLRAQAPEFSSRVKIFLKLNEGAASYLGDFDRNSCEDDTPTRWIVYLNSTLGDFRFDFDFNKALNTEQAVVETKIGEQGYFLNLSSSLSNLAAAKLCKQAENESHLTLASSSPEGQDLIQPIKLLIPDCKLIPMGTKGISCEFQHQSETSLMSSLDEIKRNMSNKWNHQPYLLIRRLTLAKQFLEGLESRNSSHEIRRVCRIIQQSLSNELPLSFQSKLWQDRVCRTTPFDKTVALIGLDLAAREIKTLSRRIEDASLIGYFTLALPHNRIVSKDFWITLQPVDSPHIVLEQSQPAIACLWHPLFIKQLDHQLIAAELSSDKTMIQNHCQNSEDLNHSKKLADTYIRSSIASEMEFEISNGQSKKLRLPTGDYQYTITQHNGLSLDENTTAQAITPLSTGSLSWKTTRPHTIIRSW